MKKTSIILSTIAIIISIISIMITISNRNSEPVSSPTTEAVETTEAQIETTKDDTISSEKEETEIYQNPELFKEVEILDSELPFDIEGIDIKTAKLFIPLQHIGTEDVWENSYIVIECDRTSENVCCKFEPSNGIHTGNIVAKEDINLTAIYIDGIYSENYNFGRDGKMIYINNFPSNAKKVEINNKSSFPIFSGEIAGEDVVVDNITLKF